MLDLFLLVWNWLELHTRWVDELGGDKSDTITIDHTQTPTMNEVTSSNPLEWEEPVTPAPVTPAMPTAQNPDVLVGWDSQKHNYHNVRVLCDLSGLTVDEKNLICACIFQESEFLNYYFAPDPRAGQPVIHENLNKDGSISSTDHGIVQINDYFHIQPTGQPFTTVNYVMNHPDACVQFMIDMYKKGQLSQWDSYLHGAYRQWLLPTSPMWKLAAAL